MSKSPLSEENTLIIKATIPVLQQNGGLITKTFYSNMFCDFPSLWSYFPSSHQGICPFDIKVKSPEELKEQMRNDTTVRPQQGALAASVLAAAQHIDDLSAILPVVAAIAHKHCSVDVIPDHYDIVGAQLLRAIKERLGDAATEPIMEAWGAYYAVLAKVFIDAEKEIYEQAEKQKGGWKGQRQFTVAEKVQEADDVFSFILKPVDGSPLPKFMAGQYIAMMAEIPDVGPQRRNYSLSAPLNQSKNTFRISVRREVTEGQKDGSFSSWLHDEVKVGTVLELSPPFGVFGVDAESDAPVMLLSAGVGQTPLVAMFEDLAESKTDRPVVFVRQCRNSHHDELHSELTKVAQGNMKIITFYSQPLKTDKVGVHYDFAGHVTAKDLAGLVTSDTQVYMVGPQSFQFDMAKYFAQVGTPLANIHSHGFGPMNSTVAEGFASYSPKSSSSSSFVSKHTFIGLAVATVCLFAYKHFTKKQ